MGCSSGYDVGLADSNEFAHTSGHCFPGDTEAMPLLYVDDVDQGGCSSRQIATVHTVNGLPDGALAPSAYLPIRLGGGVVSMAWGWHLRAWLSRRSGRGHKGRNFTMGWELRQRRREVSRMPGEEGGAPVRSSTNSQAVEGVVAIQNSESPVLRRGDHSIPFGG